MRILLCFFLFLVPVCSSAQSYDLTEADKRVVIEAVIAHLETDYVDAEIGARAAQQLRDEPAFSSLTEPKEFAEMVSQKIQTVTGDGHLNIEFSEKSLEPESETDEAFEAEQMERWYGRHINFGVQRAERLAHNIGYIDLRVFAPIDMGGDTISAAMNMIAQTDALIIDLRKNGGGIGDTADLVASYLFGPERQPLTGIYDRPSDTLTQRFTQAYVPGPRFGGEKPVYVLLSDRTFSAAEALAYNLQALDRAVIVGETSAGGAHPFEYVPIHEHFVLWSVTAKSINPITGTNWQSVGVTPDISVPAEDALAAALTDYERRYQTVSN